VQCSPGSDSRVAAAVTVVMHHDSSQANNAAGRRRAAPRVTVQPTLYLRAQVGFVGGPIAVAQVLGAVSAPAILGW